MNAIIGVSDLLPRLIPDAFLDGAGKVPNNPLIAAAVEALFKGGPGARALTGGWSEESDGRVVYRHQGKRGGQLVLYVDADRPGADETGACDPRNQWRVIETFGPLTADVMLLVLGQLCEASLGDKPKYPQLAPVSLTATALLRYKKFKSWGTARCELRERVAEEIGRLQMLRFDVHQFPAWDPATRRWNASGVSIIGDRIFDVVEARVHRAGEQQFAEAVWRIRFGQWAQWWMNAQAKVWLGSMPHFLLKLDHRKNRALAVLAKKVGINTILLWGAIRERRTLVRRIDRLLEDVGELPQPEARHCHWAGRTRDRFEDAMLLLQEAGIFGRVAWPEGSGPGDTDRNKGWLARWLATKITIYQNATETADVAGEIVHRKSAKRRRKRSPDGATLRGNLIRSLRTSRSLTQGQLAKELGVSPAYLSHIENEKRLLSQAVLQRLLLWITAGNVGEPSRH